MSYLRGFNRFILVQINIKKRARCGSVLRATCGLPEENEISTKLTELLQVYVILYIILVLSIR